MELICPGSIIYLSAETEEETSLWILAIDGNKPKQSFTILTPEDRVCCPSQRSFLFASRFDLTFISRCFSWLLRSRSPSRVGTFVLLQERNGSIAQMAHWSVKRDHTKV
jgi:hypothetical protein